MTAKQPEQSAGPFSEAATRFYEALAAYRGDFIELARQNDRLLVWIVGLASAAIVLTLPVADSLRTLGVTRVELSIAHACFILSILLGIIGRFVFHQYWSNYLSLIFRLTVYLSSRAQSEPPRIKLLLTRLRRAAKSKSIPDILDVPPEQLAQLLLNEVGVGTIRWLLDYFKTINEWANMSDSQYNALSKSEQIDLMGRFLSDLYEQDQPWEAAEFLSELRTAIRRIGGEGKWLDTDDDSRSEYKPFSLRRMERGTTFLLIGSAAFFALGMTSLVVFASPLLEFVVTFLQRS